MLLLGGCADSYEFELLALDGVSDVPTYLNYEGAHSAEVVLINRKMIRIEKIRANYFDRTDRIYVNRVGKYAIVCRYPNQKGIISSGHNIIEILDELMDSDSKKMEINNLQDLVDNIDNIESLISKLPRIDEPGRSIFFRGREPSKWLCQARLLEN